MTTIDDIHDLHRILVEHPEWRSELRNIILTQELLEVPDRLDTLTATVQALADTSSALLEHAEATNRRLDSMETHMDNMESHMGGMETRMGGVETRMDSMESRMDTLQSSMDEVKSDVRELKTDVGTLKTDMGSLTTTVDKLRGDGLEDRLTSLIPPLLSREFDVRRVYSMWASRTLASNQRRDEFERTLEEASDSGRITDDEETRLQVTDLIVRSQRKSDRSTLWFAVEASGVISDEDVTRVVRSVNAIRKVYAQDAIPIVYGYEISDENMALASEHDVRVYLNPDRR